MNLYDKNVMFKRFLVIGVGLIGGSVCKAVRKKGLANHIIGFSRRLETAHEALSLGLIDECVSDPSDPNIKKVDGVFLAIPVGQYEAVLRQFLPVLPPSCLIFDGGSTKHDVAELVQSLSAQFPALPSRFVGSHPIAGGEKHGPSSAVADLFDNKACIICPNEKTEEAKVQAVKRFWEHLGARIQFMNALDHDEMFGAISHLPHFLAFAYIAGVRTHPKGELFMQEGGAGFRDFTRIAASSSEMWADIFQSNHKAMFSMLDRFDQASQDMRKAIEKGDREKLDEILNAVRQYRENWKGTPHNKRPTTRKKA